MSLLRLLSTGKSLVGVREEPGQYHVPEEPLLPRFEGKKNPFRATALPGQSKAGDEHAGEQPPAAEELLAAAVTASAQNCAPACVCSVESSNATAGATVKPGLWQRIRSLVRKPALRPQKGSSPMPQQTELKLDGIKVMRNDLSETDIEVVPRNLSAASAKAAPVSNAPAPEAVAASAWGRVSMRVFGGKEN